MKILYLADDFPPTSYGGGGVVAYNLAKEMARRGNEVFVLTTVQKREEEKKEILDGLIVYRIYSNYPYPYFLKSYISLYNPLTISKIKKIAREIKPDIVHSHHIHSHISYYSFKVVKKIGAKVYLTAHDTMLVSYGKSYFSENDENYKISLKEQIKAAGKIYNYNPFRNIIIRHYLKYVDKIFTVSDAVKRVLCDNGIINTETIYNGIDVFKWRASYNENKIKEFKYKYNLEGKKIIFWGGGRLSGAKGSTQILKAIKIIKENYKNINAVLVIAGNKGYYTDKIEKMTADFKIDKFVILTGKLNFEEMQTAFFACDLSVTPSICFDSFPTVNLEAMVAKKPVVATCFGGSKELIKDNETGYIINPNNEELMAEKIFDLLQNQDKAKLFGEKGLKRIKNFFSIEMQTDKTLEWYNKQS